MAMPQVRSSLACSSTLVRHAAVKAASSRIGAATGSQLGSEIVIYRAQRGWARDTTSLRARRTRRRIDRSAAAAAADGARLLRPNRGHAPIPRLHCRRHRDVAGTPLPPLPGAEVCLRSSDRAATRKRSKRNSFIVVPKRHDATAPLQGPPAVRQFRLPGHRRSALVSDFPRIAPASVVTRAARGFGRREG
jgi:hypothetical protein